MSVQLNHTIVWCNDKQAASSFLAEILGRPPPRTFFHFLVVDFDNGVSLDFMQKEGPVALQHYAFLLDDETWTAAFERIKARSLTFWADPARSKPGEINTHDGGRGCYFEDPSGHLLEIITRPYGSG